MNTCLRVVLDTHVLLDWLVFDDPRTAFIEPALRGGQLHWFAAPNLRTEFDAVVARTHIQTWKPDADRIAQAWSAWAEAAAGEPAAARWRCTDPDDQKFFDLALHVQADALLTRDRALLKLARHARTQGLAIARPEDWWPRQVQARVQAQAAPE